MQPRWTSIILFPELPQRLPALPKNGNWNAEAVLQKEKEKGRECFVGSVAPWCLPSSVRQVEGATVWHCDSGTARRLEHTGHPYLTAQHRGRTTSSAWQLPLAPEFAMRKPTLQLQVGGKRKKKNLSGKQVRRQLMWDTCRIHAAHLNLTLSASLYVGGEAQWCLLCSAGEHGSLQSTRTDAITPIHNCQWHHHRRSQTERQLQHKLLA